MKRKVLFVASLFLATATFAQDGLTSKKGEAYLPEAGDWVIGFDGTPFLNYAGNMFNGTNGTNTLNATWVGNQPNNTATANLNGGTIYGKMFKDENTAYRAKLRIGVGSGSSETLGFWDQDLDASTNQVEYTNTAKTSGFAVTLGAGYEKRKGNTRIQGFYGGEVLIGLGNSSQSWDYGRAYTEENHLSIGDETDGNGNGGAVQGTLQGTADAKRVTERYAGSTFQFGLRGFIGVEWFVAPKVSLSAEYGWGLAMTSTSGGEETVEYFGFAEGATAETLNTETIKTGGSNTFGIDTDNNAATIAIFFHF
jgi:hypothetical protein